MKEGFFYKAFTEAEHPRDEKGRFTEKGEAPKKWYEKPPATKEELLDFATRALNKNTNERLFIGYINTETQKRIKEITGLEAKTIILDSDSIRHALNKETHNITIEDLQYMKEVINNADNIKISNKKFIGNSVILFSKDIDGEIIFVEELRANRGQLELLTCYRKKKKPAINAVMLHKTIPPTAFVRNAFDSQAKYSVISDEGGHSSISHSGKPNPAVSFSARSDNNIISQSDEKSSINEELPRLTHEKK